MSFDYSQYFDIKVLISLASAALSATSLYFTRRFWLATNRPIVSAAIVSCNPGNISITYNLVVYNTGNRPATSIRLHADKEILDSIINSDADKKLIDGIYHCFSSDSVIPLLINGKDTSTFFGVTSINPKQNALKYKSLIPIREGQENRVPYTGVQ